jgi:hypothetical protein
MTPPMFLRDFRGSPRGTDVPEMFRQKNFSSARRILRDADRVAGLQFVPALSDAMFHVTAEFGWMCSGLV